MRFASIILLSLLTMNILGCQKNSVDIDSTKIEGKWKRIGQNTGLPDGYVDVKDGEEIFLNDDGTFKKGEGKCNEGNYAISDKNIIFDYSCEEKESMLNEGVQKWSYSLENGVMRITPTYQICDEGCYYDYKKISDN